MWRVYHELQHRPFDVEAACALYAAHQASPERMQVYSIARAQQARLAAFFEGMNGRTPASSVFADAA